MQKEITYSTSSPFTPQYLDGHLKNGVRISLGGNGCAGFMGE